MNVFGQTSFLTSIAEGKRVVIVRLLTFIVDQAVFLDEGNCVDIMLAGSLIKEG
jgi:hypothetical protein